MLSQIKAASNQKIMMKAYKSFVLWFRNYKMILADSIIFKRNRAKKYIKKIFLILKE